MEKSKVSEGSTFERLEESAATAMVLHSPAHAVEATNELFMYYKKYGGPSFASRLAIQAAAQHALGDEVASDRTASLALSLLEKKSAENSRLPLQYFLLTARHFNNISQFARARKLYEIAVEEKVPRAHLILGDLGLAYARAGHTKQALDIVEELRKTRKSTKVDRDGRIGGEKLSAAIRALTGNPFAGFSREQSYYFSLVAAAQSLAERENTPRLAAILREIDGAIASTINEESAAWVRIRSEAATVYARTGNANRAEELLRSSTQDLARAWANSAGALCQAGHSEGARAFLDTAASYVHALAPTDLAYVGLGYANCGIKSLAREYFYRARIAADKVPFCHGDHCANFTAQAQRAVANVIIQSDDVDLLDGWPAKTGPALEHQIRGSAIRARAGMHDIATERLRSIAEKNRSLPMPLQVDLSLARGEIAMIAGNKAQAMSDFATAYRVAKALEPYSARIIALYSVAKSQTRSDLCPNAITVLDEARINVDRLRMSLNDSGNVLAAIVSSGYAKCGAYEQALATTQSLLEDASSSFGRDHDAKLLAIDILAEIAVKRAEQGEIEHALKEISTLPSTLSKITAAVNIEIAESKHLQSNARPAKVYLAEQLSLAGDYFLEALGDLERRILISRFASAARRIHDANISSPHGSLFALLETEVSKMRVNGWRAKAMCELGVAAQNLGLPEWKRILEGGISMIGNSSSSRLEYEAPPNGACAYWVFRSGDQSQAWQINERAMDSLRKMSLEPNIFRPQQIASHALAQAVSLSEYASGEIMIDWATLWTDRDRAER